MYIAARDAGVVTVVNTQTNGVVRTFFVSGGQVQNVTVSRDGSTLFATDIARSRLISWDIISGSAAFQQRAIGSGSQRNAFDVAVTPDNAQVYVSTLADGKVYVLNRATRVVLDSIITRGSARYIGFTANGSHAIIPNEAGWVNYVH